MISALIGIDPGTRALGWVRGTEAGIVISAGCSRVRPGAIADMAAEHARAIGHGTSHLAHLEAMHWDGRRPTTVGDLLDVQAVGAIVAARVAAEIRMVKPGEWKGTIPKEIHHPRLLAVLDPAERRIVDAACAQAGATHAKEVLDALGIMMQGARRIGRSGGVRE